MNSSLVSVIMPAYNAQQFIEESIRSVMNQTFTQWELIITDDGSTDQTKGIIERLMKEDQRIKYYYQPNGKQGKARNMAICQAGGKYIAFLDADDIWMSNKLASQVELIEKTNADVVYCDAVVIDEDGKLIRGSWGVKQEVLKGDKMLASFFSINKIPILTAVVKLEALEKVCGFNEDPKRSYIEDYDLWLRLIKNGATLINTSEKLAAYRLSGDETSQRRSSVKKIVEMLAEFKLEDAGLIKAKEKAIKNWIKKFIINYPSVNKSEVKEIINYYPGMGKFFLNLIFSITPILSRRIFIFSTLFNPFNKFSRC
jgi:glycosyltransferase involved in cell wall biosynthesis